MHVAVIGTGRVGQMTLILLAHEIWIKKLTLVDIKPKLAEAVAEELRHSLASTRIPMEVYAYDVDAAVENADIVLVTAGAPRSPEMEDRNILLKENAKTIKDIAEKTAPNNPQAKYIVVTNPVDSMAMLFKKISQVEWVISTGTNLESQRFRAELSKQLNVPITDINGFVGGEHGKEAVFLWSTVRICGIHLEDYLAKKKIHLNRKRLEEDVKEISRSINDRVLSIAAPYKIPQIPEPVLVSIPQMVGKNFGFTMENSLTEEERKKIKKAALRIYQTYKEALEII
jgi:malate dehydrogenase